MSPDQFSPVGESRSADPAIQPAGERPRTVLGQAYQDVAARSADERTARAEQRLQEWRRPPQTPADARQG